MKAWEKNIRKVVPYVPGEQPDKVKMVKLNTNENPYPPAPGVKRAVEEFDYERLKLYPDPTVGKLTKAIAEHHNVDADQVFVGVGSDDVIAMMFLTFFNSDKPILFPDISYSFYSVWANLFGIPFERPALDDNFRIIKEDYYRENGGIIFPNPNAPTSVYEDLELVEDILEHNRDVIVIVDEAYIDFGGRSAIELIDRYDNLMVVQTYSKSRSMAGMRIGYAVGNPVLIKYLNDAKHSFNSYTMNQTSIAFGIEAIRDEEYFRDTLAKIMATRERTKKEMAALGFMFPEPMANFIFATHEKYPAKELFEALREKDIYVRYFTAPRIDNYLRITIGTDEEMDQLIGFFKEYMK
ncbi:histidinol-phosphate transaminase [Anaerobium acetethylicum]|uniref:Histidinol-phosphate aminotransferase n=1 Tax=Anaerobium acetethylicum TaxID=1619234 RepID=A0A1D3TVX8_9FIRM|nr:histidinol-phosphate transaminase [Anaerobium acetethylicum]SCP98318.1 histidinol-phosphate aminotransferase [Anaerobium acetethylicum]